MAVLAELFKNLDSTLEDALKGAEAGEYSGVKSITCPVFGNHYSV